MDFFSSFRFFSRFWIFFSRLAFFSLFMAFFLGMKKGPKGSKFSVFWLLYNSLKDVRTHLREFRFLRAAQSLCRIFQVEKSYFEIDRDSIRGLPGPAFVGFGPGFDNEFLLNKLNTFF